MAKKKSRSRRKSQRKSISSRSSVEITQAANTTPAKVQDLTDEYRYVSEDLIRIGIIAAILIGVLVGLSFFL